MSKSKEQLCAKCGAELAAFATEGFCSACLLERGLDALDPTERVTSSASEAPGDRIDRYKLLQQIGEGGCGVVYMAEQTEPVRRRVALKVIKLGMDTRQVIGRFEAERQALALMDHPNIAKVFDAGATATGRPYFVMELVKGIRITDYCDQNHLSTRQRLDLFTQVCQAIQHAHQKGIIHRDIKPSNILVTLHDGVPVPKVIDFGIAKATEQPLTEKTVFTALGQFMGTPAYMSPEQAELSGLDIDTRSDIYALGVLLYELLTGRTPFDAKELWQAGLDEMRRRIREEEPVRPSTRLSTMADADLTQVAQHRQSEPAKLTRFLRGDLDWIVMKCLEKDRTRRYETANGLATDLRRHLDNEPVLACPPSAAYRFQKLIRRNKLGFAAVSAVAAALVIGLGIAAWQFFEKSKAYNRAVAAEKQAGIHAEAEASQRKLAEVNASKAEQATKLEAEQRTRAEKLAEESGWNLYAARVKLAEQQIKSGNPTHALALLNSLRPEPGQTDLRSFDWYYLWHLCHSERLSLGHKGHVLCLAYSPDGKLLATSGDDPMIRVWDASTGFKQAELRGHEIRVAALVFAPDGKKLASAGADGTVRLWELGGTNPVQVMHADTNEITTLAFSPDGRWLAAGEGKVAAGAGNPGTMYTPPGPAGRVMIWDTVTGNIERTINAQSGSVRCLVSSPDGTMLLSGGDDNTVKLHDRVSGDSLAVQTNLSGTVVGAFFSQDASEVAIATWHPYHESGKILVLDGLTLDRKRTLVEDAGRILCLAGSADGTKLASSGLDRTVRLHDFVTGTELASFHGLKNQVWALAFTPDSTQLAAAGWDGMVKVWDVEASPVRQRIPTRQSFSVAFSPNGKFMATGFTVVEIREASSGNLVRTLSECRDDFLRVAFSPDGSVLAATGEDGSMHFWDTGNWNHWTSSPKGADSAKVTDATSFEPDTHFAFSPDSRTLVMPGFDKIIRFWDVKTGKLVDTIEGYDTWIASVGFTPDGQTLLTGSSGELCFWDLATKRIKFSIPGKNRILRVSADGRWLAFESGTQIEIREMATMQVRATLRGHSSTVYCVAFSHDSRLLASASWDGTVRIWHVLSGQELLTIPANVGVVSSTAFGPDDRSLVIGSGVGEAGSAVVVLRAASYTNSTAPDSSAVLLPLLVEKTRAFSRQGRWTEAAKNQARLVQMEPTNYLHYHFLAPILVAGGQAEEYRRHCQAMQIMFAQIRKPGIAERLAKACLILPHADEDFGFINRTVEIALMADPSNSLFPYAQFVSGLAAYRQGNYASAIERVQQVLANPTPEYNLEVEAWMVLAMAQHGLNQTNKARTALTNGLEIDRTKLPTLKDGDLGWYWNDWIISQALSREAQALIDGKVTDPFAAPK